MNRIVRCAQCGGDSFDTEERYCAECGYSLSRRSAGSMPLRDEFAKAALMGLCTTDSWMDLQGHGKLVASICYEMADAMLDHRTSNT